MKKVILIAAMFAASAAFAGNDKGDTNNTYNQPGAHATGGQGGSAQAGAAALAGAIATGGNSSATGGNSNASGGSVIGSGNSSNSNKIDNKNTNNNLNAQGQGQSQTSKSNAQQGQAQSTENANNSRQSVTVEGDNYEAQKRAPVSTAYSAGLTSTNGTCFGSASAGLQVAGFGVTGGSTTFDENCDIRYDAIALREAGQTKAAVARLCQKPAMAEAMKAAGTPCTNASVSTAKTSANYSEAPVAKYEHTDPIVRARLGLPPLK